MTSAAHLGLVSNDYNSDNSSKYDPSSDDENHTSYNKLQQLDIDDDEIGDCGSLTPQEPHRLSNKVSIFSEILPYNTSIKCVLYRFACNTTTFSNNYLHKIMERVNNHNSNASRTYRNVQHT